MSQQTSPWLEGAYGWNFGENNWNSGMDQNLLKFSFMFDRNVDSITASLPAAVNGQAHYLTTDNRLYFAVGTTYFSTPVPKWFVIVLRGTGQTHQFNGTSLVQIDTPIQLDSRLDAVELSVTNLSAFDTNLQNTSDPAKGAALVGYSGSTVRARLETLKSRAGFAADQGAVGDGVTDDTVALKAARDAYGLVELEDGKTYAISSQVAATADGQGFFCNGKATIKMLTTAGKFDRSSYGGTKFDVNSCGVYCLGFDRYTLDGVAITMEANASVRTIMPFALRDSRDNYVKMEAYGFKESEDGVVVLDSVVDSHIIANVHDCGTADSSLPSMQISAINIDDERITSIPTTNTFVHGYGKNIVLTGAALTAYGPQTDGVNVAGLGDNHGLKILCQFENVGEGFDCFGSYVKATVQVKTCAAYGVKLIHGAQHCIIDAIIDNTGGAAINFGGSNTASQDVAHNHITATVSNIGAIASSLVKAAVQFDGPSATFKPRDNYAEVLIESNASMVYAAFIEAGINNVVQYTSTGTQTVLEANIAASAGTGNIIRRINTEDGGYVAGRYYGGDYVNLSATTTLTLTANTLYAIPFRVHDTLKATKIGLHVQTSAAGSARLGIYKWTNGAPGALVHDAGTLSVSSTGDVEVSINSGFGVTLTGGMYALAVVSDVAPIIYASGANFGSLNATGVGTPGTADSGISRAFTYAALPASFGTVTYAAANMPNLWLRNV